MVIREENLIGIFISGTEQFQTSFCNDQLLPKKAIAHLEPIPGLAWLELFPTAIELKIQFLSIQSPCPCLIQLLRIVRITVLALWIILSNICLNLTWHLQQMLSLTSHLFSHIAVSSLNTGLLCILNGDHSPIRRLAICSSLFPICVYKSLKKRAKWKKKNPDKNHLILQKLIIHINKCWSPYSNSTHPKTLCEVGGFVLDTTLKKVRKFTLSWWELPCLYGLCLFTTAFDETFISIFWLKLGNSFHAHFLFVYMCSICFLSGFICCDWQALLLVIEFAIPSQVYYILLFLILGLQDFHYFDFLWCAT